LPLLKFQPSYIATHSVGLSDVQATLAQYASHLHATTNMSCVRYFIDRVRRH